MNDQLKGCCFEDALEVEVGLKTSLLEVAHGGSCRCFKLLYKCWLYCAVAEGQYYEGLYLRLRYSICPETLKFNVFHVQPVMFAICRGTCE